MRYQKELNKITRSAGLLALALILLMTSVYGEEDPMASMRGEGLLPPVSETDASTNVSPKGLRIQKIDVVGNVSMSRGEVISLVRSRSGELFDEATVEEDVRRIAQNKGVEYAYYNSSVVNNQVLLTYVVVEKNLIRSIEIRGNKAVTENKLLKDTGLRIGDYLDIFVARSAVEIILETYKKKGYAFAQVQLNESEFDQGIIIFDVVEDSRVKIRQVIFTGNHSIKSSELLKGIKTKPKKFYVWQLYYQAKQLREDEEKLRTIYRNEGYPDCQVRSNVEFTPNQDGAIITFDIIEGSLYTTADISITGSTYFDEDYLLQEAKLKVGEFYSDQKSNFDKEKILGKFLAVGFINADVTVQRSFPEKGKVNVAFEISEGERFKIGHIIITGNEMTHDKVVRRVLDDENFVPGQWYNADIARGNGKGHLEKEIRQSMFAESAFIKPAGAEGDKQNALVNVIEGQTGSVMVGAGVASDNGLIGQLVFDQRNFDIGAWPDSLTDIFSGRGFKGAGQRLRISLEPGTEYSRYSVSFTEPFLFDKPVSLSTGWSAYQRERESFEENRSKYFVAFEKRYRDKWRRGIAIRVENVEVSDIDIDAPQEIFDVKGDNWMYGFKVFIGKDTTDDRFLPTLGFNFDTGFEYVAGNHTFGILDMTQRWYKTLHEDYGGLKTVLETKFYAATILGDAPPFEKFYAGGTGSIRGFEYRGVSTRGQSVTNPNKNDDPIGSDWIVSGNVEVSVPLGTETFSGLLFVDSAMIDTGGIRVSIGTGIQILLPQWFGPVPMRFELASPLMKDEDDETRVFSFSVGALF